MKELGLTARSKYLTHDSLLVMVMNQTTRNDENNESKNDDRWSQTYWRPWQTQLLSLSPWCQRNSKKGWGQNKFYDARLEVSIGDIVADYDKDGGGNEVAAEEGTINDVDFDDSVSYDGLLSCPPLANAARVQQESWEKSSALVSCKGARPKQLNLASSSGPVYCRQLNLKFREIGYYHDVHGWLPHEQWGIMFMRVCKNCNVVQMCASFLSWSTMPEQSLTWPAVQGVTWLTRELALSKWGYFRGRGTFTCGRLGCFLVNNLCKIFWDGSHKGWRLP
jgi:hypothetical protein